MGRWWALAAALAAGVWITLSTGVDEVPPWFLGLVYGGFAGAGIALGYWPAGACAGRGR